MESMRVAQSFADFWDPGATIRGRQGKSLAARSGYAVVIIEYFGELAGILCQPFRQEPQ
jgi:hypothetical protein